MGVRADPVIFAPIGLTDSIDGTLTQGGEGQVFGNMSELENLIPDPTTRGIWRCRPAAIEKYDFADFLGAGFVSCLFRFGRYIYGMVASTTTVGYDEPFCYDVVGDVNIPITGVTGLNVPVSPSTSGEWDPPHMELVGVYLIITHPGYDGVTNFFGWINLSNPASPTYSAGNVTTSGTGAALTSVPTWCTQYYQRAYFLLNPTTGQPSQVFTDPLTLNVSDAAHVLTYGDNTRLTVSKGVAYNTQLSGGVVQFMLVFKGVSDIYQVQGDAASTSDPLKINALNVSTGTLAPNSVVSTTKGIMFMAPDGVRLIDFNAKITDPIGAYGQGVALPFIFAAVPSRVVAAFSSGVLRISVQNNAALNAPVQEYWLHTALGIWSGPHSFPAAQIVPYDSSFMMVASGVNAKLWQSDVLVTASSTFGENGTQLSWDWGTVMLPDPGAMAEMSIAGNECTIDMALVAGMPPLTITALDQDDVTLGTATYTPSGTATVWGAFVWGASPWGGAPNGLRPRLIQWTDQVVYRRLKIHVTGESRSDVRIGKLAYRRSIEGYIQQEDNQ